MQLPSWMRSVRGAAPAYPKRARSATRISDRRRGALQLGEDSLLHLAAVLLAVVEAVARADELHPCGPVIAALLDAHGDQRAGKRRGLHPLLLDHGRAAQAVAEVVAQHLDGDLRAGAEVPQRLSARIHGHGQSLG